MDIRSPQIAFSVKYEKISVKNYKKGIYKIADLCYYK